MRVCRQKPARRGEAAPSRQKNLSLNESFADRLEHQPGDITDRNQHGSLGQAARKIQRKASADRDGQMLDAPEKHQARSQIGNEVVEIEFGNHSSTRR